MTEQAPSFQTRESVYLDPRERVAQGDRLGDQLRLEQAHRHRANGRLIAGIAIGAAIAIGASMYFAREAGSFSDAGAVVDRQIDTTATEGQDAAADAARSVGDAARTTGATVDQQLSDAAAKAERR